jgi:hypothetical protein
MLFEPNRWPRPRPMLDSPVRFALGALAIAAIAIVLIIVLPLLAEALGR